MNIDPSENDVISVTSPQGQSPESLYLFFICINKNLFLRLFTSYTRKYAHTFKNQSKASLLYFCAGEKKIKVNVKKDVRASGISREE